MRAIQYFGKAIGIFCLAVVVAIPVAGQAEQDRLDPLGDPVRQLIDYASALDIAEDEITSAIFEGRFVPDADDLRLVMRTLWDKTCSQDLKDVLSDPWVSPGQILSYDCLMRATIDEGSAAETWNARFGLPPEEERFLLASRLSYMLTREEGPWTDKSFDTARTDPAARRVMMMLEARPAPYYFIWTDQTDPQRDFQGRYSEMRADYLAGLSDRISVQAQDRIGLVDANRAVDVLDDVSSADGGILKSYASGNRELVLWRAIARDASPVDQDWVRTGRDQLERLGTPDLRNIAAWALIRIDSVGPCGDPVTAMISRTTQFTDVYRGNLFEERIEGSTSETTFTALAAFSNIIEVAPTRLGVEFDAYQKLAQVLGCDSSIRRGLEANMVAMFRGEPLPYRSGF